MANMVNPPRSVDPLVVGKVIGDVVDMFVPVVEFSVEYGSKQISNGVEIKPAAAAQKPRVHIQGSRGSNNLYTLVMADPDAPSPSEPTFREWLHWIVTDIAEGGDASEGRELMEYMGPQPPTGIHRYVFTLFRQTEAEQVPHKPPERRANFKTRQFASENGLGLPVAALYFNSQKGHAAANKKH
ncbi:PREDICTED: protein MOTHER of FT and TFL1-like [Nicotiana attenuata]|uniref:Protein mother of ft and tfl1 n=1 Tax=Nicotiana attenuata TaxID=49451 RepID=A0A314KLJ5_NICAT|nr:PREDICTED: protein MOTHER of FT and TFL1-like [Nicotiana attenuata]OIT30150.1 protein mother of ft and tfl1 [Nicotiana attenuata]